MLLNENVTIITKDIIKKNYICEPLVKITFKL